MAFKSILSPPVSVGMALATGLFVWAIYDRSLPDGATMHATDAGDVNIEAGRKKATYTALAAVTGITLLTRDVNVFIVGGATLAALDFHARHANATNPVTGNLVADTGYAPGLRAVS